jgi:hypothetical protein
MPKSELSPILFFGGFVVAKRNLLFIHLKFYSLIWTFILAFAFPSFVFGEDVKKRSPLGVPGEFTPKPEAEKKNAFEAFGDKVERICTSEGDKIIRSKDVDRSLADIEKSCIGKEVNQSQLILDGENTSKDLIEMLKIGEYKGTLESTSVLKEFGWKYEPVKTGSEEIKKSANNLKETDGKITEGIRNCANRGERADLACCEGTSTHAKEIRTVVGSALPALTGLSSKLACSKYKNAITAVAGIMTLWNATCLGFKSNCESSCEDVSKHYDLYLKEVSNRNKLVAEQFTRIKSLVSEIDVKIEKIRNEIKDQDQRRLQFCPKSNGEYDKDCHKIESTLRNLNELDLPNLEKLKGHAMQYLASLEKTNTKVSACYGQVNELNAKVQARFNKCTAWGKDMAASLVGIGGLIMQAKQKSKCGPGEEPNTCNTSAPTAATCAAFCADAANKSNPACRCILNPLASGCMDGSNSGYANGGGAGKYNTMNFNKPGAMGPGADPTTNPAPEFGGPSSGNGGGGPSGRGGGGGGLGGGGSVLGSSSKPAGGAAGKAGSRIDPNVISGFEGGGGASGSKGGGGYGAGSNSALIDKLKSELKTKADKLRGLASEDDPRLQITGAGGKTNWEKISDRYRDMTGQMIKDD